MPANAFTTPLYGGTDNFGAEATYQHGLIVINGQCAQQSSQLTDVEYRLVRGIGNILGLGWSQLNLNVITGNPPATTDYYAGFPVMHYMDSTYCVPISTGQPFQPVVVRAVDSASPPDPVLGAVVNFQMLVMRPAAEATNQPTTPVILNVSQSSVVSDSNGLASVAPLSAGFSGPLEVNIMATTGTNATADYPLQLLPALNSRTEASGTNRPILHAPLRTRLPIQIEKEGNQ